MMIPLILSILLPLAVAQDDDGLLSLTESPPKFHRVVDRTQSVYLGDKVKLNCVTDGNPRPSVFWFRGNETIESIMANDTENGYRERKMHLEIKRVHVWDNGDWSCLAWNRHGNVTRNFTIDVIDYCDVFLGLPANDVPMECVCFWRFTKETIRTDIDFRLATVTTCRPYSHRIQYHARKPFVTLPCFNPPCDNLDGSSTTTISSRRTRESTEEDESYETTTRKRRPTTTTTRRPRMTMTVRSTTTPYQDDDEDQGEEIPVRSATSYTPLTSTTDRTSTSSWYSTTAVFRRNSSSNRPQRKHERDLDEIELKEDGMHVQKRRLDYVRDYHEDEEEDEDEEKESKPLSKMLPKTSIAVEDVPKDMQPRRQQHILEEKSAPYIPPEELNKTIITPAGRTLKLQCKSEGSPEPKPVWYKNGVIITVDTRRLTGGEYKMKSTTMELVDVTESDSGVYNCTVSNPLGTASRLFNVTIVSRMRSPPKIVPNVLMNQTVNVNDTATFKCEVMSDLHPHIMWVRINRDESGLPYYYNHTAREYMFNYTNAENIKHAQVIAEGYKSTLILNDVTLADQGMYACISGNILGKVMANATLIVNEFLGVNLLTGEEKIVSETNTSLIIAIFLAVICVLIGLTIAALCVVHKQKKRALSIQQQALLPKKKLMIVARKRGTDDAPGEGWSDLPSSYQIQIIEKDINGLSNGKRMRLNSDLTAFSEFEVETDPVWEIERERLKLGEMLGEGAFGEVWKGLMRKHESDEETPVAVKRLKGSAHQKELIDLFSEAQMFKIIGKHENVLKLIGCCTGCGPLYVVLELCVHGNLRDFLRAHRPQEDKGEIHPIKTSEDDDYLSPRKFTPKCVIPNLTQRHLVEFAAQVAKGMKYMSSLKIIHRDLAARNVLVTEGLVMKISDFGLSRDVQSADYYRKKGNGRLPIKWMALEALDSHMYTVESDVWSFGILLWEIMTLGGTPYPTIAMPQLYACLKEGYRMEAPHNCPDEIYNLMVACWQEKRENRPNFETIVDYFDWMLMESAKADEFGDEDHTIKSRSSGDFGGSSANSSSGEGGPGSLSRRKKMRPLSAPVLLPSEPAPHDICDDEENIGELLPQVAEFLPPSTDQVVVPPLSPVTHRRIVEKPVPDRPLPPPPLPFLSHKSVQIPPRIMIIRSPPPPPLTMSQLSRSKNSLENYLDSQALLPKNDGPDSAIGSPSATDTGDSRASVMDESPDDGASYVNILGSDTVSEGGRLGSIYRKHTTRFQFPPHHVVLKFNEEEDGVPSTASIYETGRSNLGYMPSPHPPDKHCSRFSMGSVTSSGRGGSSAASSAEGLGGIGEFCKIESTGRAQLKRQASSLDETNDANIF